VVWDKESSPSTTLSKGLALTLLTPVLRPMKILEDKKIVRRGQKIGRAFSTQPRFSRSSREGDG